MKTTSRKRLLISSVAMLLVAMLALGTATFAWFSTSTTAKANNLKVQTIQASNLLIRKGTGGTATSTDWATQISYSDENPATLEPASSTDLKTWFTALAPSYNKTGEAASSIAKLDSTTGFVVEKSFQLYYKADTGADDLSVNWGLDIAHDQDRYEDFIRVAILDSTGAPVFVYGKTADDDSLQLKSGETTVGEHSGKSNVTTVAKNAALTTFSPQDIKNYTLVVWYEGTDPQCLDENAITLNDISLTFSKANP
nr:hypothetical protein [uncultured Ruminococcus sp.]